MYTISFTDGTDDVTISGYLYILESEGIIDLYGTKYLLLSIDDYNNNYSNKSMISIENKNLGLDKSIFNNISETTSKVFINDSNSYYHQLIDRNESRTQAQIDSINNINKTKITTIRIVKSGKLSKFLQYLYILFSYSIKVIFSKIFILLASIVDSLLKFLLIT